MIQPAAPSVVSATVALAGSPADNGAGTPETGSFAELLATAPGTAPTAPAVASSGSVPALPLESDAELVGAQPILAAPLPLAGKILPGLLPGTLPESLPAAPTAPGEATPTAPDAATEAAQAVPTLLAALRALRLPQAEMPGAKPAAGLAADGASGEPGDATSEDGAPVLIASVTTTSLSLVAASPETMPETAPAATATPSGLSPLIEAQLLGRPLPLREALPGAAAAAATPAQPQDAALALRLDPAQTDPAQAAALTFEAPAARPATGLRLRPMLSAEGESPAAGLAEPALAPDTASLLGNPAPAPGVVPAAGGASGPVLSGAPQPRDFAALMDRLMTARDAAQTGLPQTVNIGLNHAEFGPISLSFQQDQNGLAVSVASPDPDFARAVQAAIPAPGSATSADGAGRDGSPSGQSTPGWAGTGLARGEASAQGGEAGQRQGRGARFDAAEQAPAANRSPARDAADPARPRGIFA
ncbi:hypothetical protein ACFOON_02940 [Novosphingobium piscinae]|uniref:Uncharacterized protein n=1 Tax=Novosphingobium piscinae TaxID=1507448 RepID=A0A7X1G1W4_9SPHN|nr:hypothetical protein [Novosphingobium piscinae]MBC2670487.1 hypothetical protein [Novosphingobium piscinae]